MGTIAIGPVGAAAGRMGGEPRFPSDFGERQGEGPSGFGERRGEGPPGRHRTVVAASRPILRRSVAVTERSSCGTGGCDPLADADGSGEPL